MPLSVSAPLIPFRETIVPPPEFDNVNEKIVSEPLANPEGVVELQSFDKRATVACRARPLPAGCVQLLEESSAELKLLARLNTDKISPDSESLQLLTEFKTRLGQLLAPSNWSVQSILSFGPNANVLFNATASGSSVWTLLDSLLAETGSRASPTRARLGLKELENSAVFGFNLAVAKGPICEEPMQGVAFFVDKLQAEAERPDEAGLVGGLV